MHEHTHATIFAIHGCENIRFGREKTAFFVTATCPDDSSELAHDINEIVGYNIMPFLGIIVFLLIKIGERDYVIAREKKLLSTNNDKPRKKRENGTKRSI